MTAPVEHEIKENDVVALLVDLPEQGLRRGDVGTVIEVFSETEHHSAGFMLEFVDGKGEVYQQADITLPKPRRSCALIFTARRLEDSDSLARCRASRCIREARSSDGV